MSDYSQEQLVMYAKELLSNPFFKEVLFEVNKDINREMDNVKPDDLKAMQGLVLLRQSMTKIITHISVSAESEKVTAFNAKPKRNLFNRG